MAACHLLVRICRLRPYPFRLFKQQRRGEESVGGVEYDLWAKQMRQKSSREVSSCTRLVFSIECIVFKMISIRLFIVVCLFLVICLQSRGT